MRKVLLTGASGRLGRAISSHLIGNNCKLALVARRQQHLDELRDALSPDEKNAFSITADLTDTASIPDMVKQASHMMGGIDVIINNAAAFHFTPFSASSPKAIDEVIDTNLRAVMHLTRAALPLLLENTNSLIVNISSLAGKYPEPGASVYSATKFGLFGFSASLFEEVRRQGVKVCNIGPGQMALDETCLSDSIPPEDIAHAVAFVLDYPSARSCPTEIIISAQ